jgi:magnesium chelatase subunit I
VPDVLRDLLELLVFEARESELIDQKSGVSARLSISALENLYSAAERRMLLNGETKTVARVSDFWGIVPSITGKVEYVYEGEQEGAYNVAMKLLGSAIQKKFLEYFPPLEDQNAAKRKSAPNRDPYGVIRAYFSSGKSLELLNNLQDKDYKKQLEQVAGLRKLVEQSIINPSETYTFMEFVLHALAEFQVISRDIMEQSQIFSDPLADMLDDFNISEN